jgi:hypothetical protein
MAKLDEKRDVVFQNDCNIPENKVKCYWDDT